jgi:hypothetical protein
VATGTGASSAEDLVRRFVAATLDLCQQIQDGLPGRTGLDPLQVIVTGNLFRLIEQRSELNGVGYFKHGIGAMLWDARRPPRVAGVVDIDLGRETDGSTCYEFYPSWINRFAERTGNTVLPENAIEQACADLVQEGVLRGCTDPFDPPPRSVIPGRWCIPRLRYRSKEDEERAWVADLGFELYWGPPGPIPVGYRERLLEARRYLELSLLPYPKPARRQHSLDWSEVTILEDKDMFPQDN